ncbi:hypothetical protein ABHA38_00310 [Enterococcus faecium]
MFLIWLGLLPQMQAFERRLSKVVKREHDKNFATLPLSIFIRTLQ